MVIGAHRPNQMVGWITPCPGNKPWTTKSAAISETRKLQDKDAKLKQTFEKVSKAGHRRRVLSYTFNPGAGWKRVGTRPIHLLGCCALKWEKTLGNMNRHGGEWEKYIKQGLRKVC